MDIQTKAHETQTRITIGRYTAISKKKMDWSYLSDRCKTYKKEAEDYAKGNFSTGNYCTSWKRVGGKAVCNSYYGVVPKTQGKPIWNED